MDDLDRITHERGAKLNYRGPRGSAKTTYISKAKPLHAAVEGYEPLILLLAETAEQSQAYLAAIKYELENNNELALAYPNACGVGSVWKSDRIKLRNGASIVARSSGGRILGITDGNTRPTLVIGDDLNSRDDAYSPTTRSRRLAWFNTDVMSVGVIGHTNFVVAGTSIHNDAITCALSRDGTWHTRQYKSIQSWPSRLDLWSEWQRRAMNLSDPDRAATAKQYLNDHYDDMHAGATLLWPERESLEDLMKLQASIGEKAFASEKQDTVGMDGSTEWPADWFDKVWFNDWPQDIVYRVAALDPSKGATDNPSDWQAMGVLALTRSGDIYIEPHLVRENVPAMCERFIGLGAVNKVNAFSCETNATMDLLLPELRRNMAKMNLVVPLQGVNNLLPKVVRIRRLSSYFQNGRIKVRDTYHGRELVRQLKEFPSSDHDDGPDMLAQGVQVLEQTFGGGR